MLRTVNDNTNHEHKEYKKLYDQSFVKGINKGLCGFYSQNIN